MDNQGTVAEEPPNDRDDSADDSDDKDSAKQTDSKTTGIKHSGPQTLKKESPIASTSSTSDTTKNSQKNLATVNPDGWHQAILPQGHAQAPQNNLKKKVPSPKERKLYSKLARRNHPHVKRSPAEVTQKMKAQEQKAKLKPPPPVYPTHRTHEDPACPMYGHRCKAGIWCGYEKCEATSGHAESSNLGEIDNDNGANGLSLKNNDDGAGGRSLKNDDDSQDVTTVSEDTTLVAHEATESDEIRHKMG